MSESPSIVLVVDDDISVRESLELLFRHEGLGVETFVQRKNFSTANTSLSQVAWYWTFLFPDLMVSICKSVLQWNGMRCPLSSSRVTEIFP